MTAWLVVPAARLPQNRTSEPREQLSLPPVRRKLADERTVLGIGKELFELDLHGITYNRFSARSGSWLTPGRIPVRIPGSLGSSVQNCSLWGRRPRGLRLTRPPRRTL